MVIKKNLSTFVSRVSWLPVHFSTALYVQLKQMTQFLDNIKPKIFSNHNDGVKEGQHQQKTETRLSSPTDTETFTVH